VGYVKRIKLSEEETKNFDYVHALKLQQATLAELYKSAHDKAWGIIKINHGPSSKPTDKLYGSYIDNETNELVCPCWKDDVGTSENLNQPS
jgi:hypothetical protein